jgi:3-deoxy-D-manno-octulosonic-acid transferase
MPRRLYSLLLGLLLPFAALWFKCRGLRHGAYRGSLRQKLGWGLRARCDRPVWLHAASIGELRALAALLPALPMDAAPLLVTVGTPTGLARARELFADNAHVDCWPAPWDLPGAVRRFLRAAQPRAGVFIETELWPNLVAVAHARAVPLTLLSARLSDRSLRGYRRWAPRLLRDTVRSFAAIGVQGEVDRARFIALGADPARVQVTGNLKFDQPQDPGLPVRGAALRARWAAARPLWVAGSTHAGEEAVLIESQRRLLAGARARGAPAPLLALVPRRPERFAAVASWLAAQAVRHERTKQAGGLGATATLDVLLVDEMGVLPEWYAAADVAFVGGSLVPVGGHNLLEPAALGRPVITGPHTFNAPDVARCLIDAGGACLVRDAQGLAACLEGWLGDASAAATAGALAAAAVAAHRGAAARSVALLTARVPAAGSRSAPSASD